MPTACLYVDQQHDTKYDAPSEVHIELNNGKKFRFACDGLSLKELHMRIDREQYQRNQEAYFEHIPWRSALEGMNESGARNWIKKWCWELDKTKVVLGTG
ncbi:uncharacterized protein EMH_0034140 [Eimeria mitis]|uniref:Uncharacterized protein n=1 Tax=Eimeria mitis TaxID=44415 RepID=U6KH49_9EIME|nr:uncharacterized protein EMH_0034140 [Eimeria mitis]CDJ36116.1 hypothetical protein, conserved [Eimeria mitis]